MSENNVKGKVGEIRATVHVTRAATGKTETFELVGYVDEEQAAALGLPRPAPRVHGASGSVVGPGAGITNPNGKE